MTEALAPTATLTTLVGHWPIFAVVLVVLLAAVAAMAVGVMFRRPCLRGSCGGPEVVTPKGDRISCITCPNRKRKHPSGDSEPPAAERRIDIVPAKLAREDRTAAP